MHLIQDNKVSLLVGAAYRPPSINGAVVASKLPLQNVTSNSRHAPRRSSMSDAASATAPDANENSSQGLSPEQLAFLHRKNLAAAGLGPIMPESSYCKACRGYGTCDCHRCNGTGINQIEPLELFSGYLKESSGESLKWWFVKGGPCWLCRGKTFLSCKECMGTGFNGGMSNFIDD